MKIINGRPVDGAGIPHHVWCNHFGNSERTSCPMCERLRKDYPEREDDDQGSLMARHFPENVVIRQ